MSGIEGGCLCGAVRYQITENPLLVEYCHCSMCRKSTGSPVVVWMDVARKDLTWAKGNPASYPSSPGISRGFCATCGSTLTFDNSANADKISLTAATLDDPAPYAPKHHIYAADQLPWLELSDHLPRHPGPLDES